MNLKELTDDKSAFQQRDLKFVNAFNYIQPGYGGALDKLKECIDRGQDLEDVRPGTAADISAAHLGTALMESIQGMNLQGAGPMASWHARWRAWQAHLLPSAPKADDDTLELPAAVVAGAAVDSAADVDASAAVDGAAGTAACGNGQRRTRGTRYMRNVRPSSSNVPFSHHRHATREATRCQRWLGAAWGSLVAGAECGGRGGWWGRRRGPLPRGPSPG